MALDIQFDPVLKAKLRATGSGSCGNLLYDWGNAPSPCMDDQLRYLWMQLKQINPSIILEVGTNEGFFCYFAHLVLPNARIVTFDNRLESDCREAVDILQAHFNKQFIKLIEGDSQETLTSFADSRSQAHDAAPIDFAWIDGSHETPVVLSDLKNCAKLKISNLFLDDYNVLAGTDIAPPAYGVRDAIDLFLHQHPAYGLVEVAGDARGIAYIRRISDG